MKTDARTASRPPQGPVQMLEAELLGLRRDLRATLRAYSDRLEAELVRTTQLVAATTSAEELSGEEMHKIRELTFLLRDRKLKPEKGRRKDLRKIELLIEELPSFVDAAAVEA